MIPYEFDAERFSRWMAYVLRHNPQRYGLKPDRHGYVEVEAFLRVAVQRYPGLNRERFCELIASEGSKRFEMGKERLRARYGHSIAVEPVGPSVEPLPTLYYGADVDQAESVRTDGLRPIERRMLHLSDTVGAALAIAQRKVVRPMVVHVRAQEAHRAGVAFYREGSLYLASHIPPPFLRIESPPG